MASNNQAAPSTMRCVRDIMTKDAVLFITAEDTLDQAFRLMAENGVRALPVLPKGADGLPNSK